MPQYLSPGVYVEEVPSAIKPIAGVSTSTAAFIGIIPDSFPIPPSFPVNGEKAIADGTERVRLKNYPASEAEGTYRIQIPGSVAVDQKIENDHGKKESYAKLGVPPAAEDEISATYFYWTTKTVANAKSKLGPPDNKSLDLDFQAREKKPAGVEAGTYKIRIKKQQGEQEATGATLKKGTDDKYSVQFDAVPSLEETDSVIIEYRLQAKNEPVGEGKKDGRTATFDLKNAGAVQEGASATLNGSSHALFRISSEGSTKSHITITKNPPKDTEIIVDYLVGGLMKRQPVSGGGQESAVLKLSDFPVLTDPKTFQVWVDNKPVQNVQIIPKSGDTPSSLKFSEPPKGQVRADYTIFASFRPAAVGLPVLCTSFSEYKRNFGDFSPDRMHSYLTHAVYGYFNNGGTRCYVIRAKDATPTEIDTAFDALDRIEDISIVLAPGVLDDGAREVIVSRCANKGDRFAIFDGSEKVADLSKLTKIEAAGGVMPKRTDVAAWYFPWIKVFDPVTKMLNPASDGMINVPPSGHIAGVYARVDTQRGVHKAPANEPLLGALGVAQPLSKAEQDGLNPKGVNCIRVINDSVLLWGARTVGGDLNTDLKYINVKRTLLFLKKSIYEGTQWVVFEPNSPALWQTITRNVTGFLTSVWRSGALLGNTPQEAFYVKCDAETNPKEAREAGQVVTEIGVAIVRPAEFVIFRISQWAGPGQ